MDGWMLMFLLDDLHDDCLMDLLDDAMDLLDLMMMVVLLDVMMLGIQALLHRLPLSYKTHCSVPPLPTSPLVYFILLYLSHIHIK